MLAPRCPGLEGEADGAGGGEEEPAILQSLSTSLRDLPPSSWSLEDSDSRTASSWETGP